MALRSRSILALAAVALASLAGASGAFACGTGGYTYAGVAAPTRAYGVSAVITPLSGFNVLSGHVAGWVGVGGPGQGLDGGDAWIQAGIASMPGMDPFLYAEITREGRDPQFVLIEEGVPVGRSHHIAVLEMSGRPGWWRVWVDGHAVTDSIELPGSSGRWAPIATAESWNAGTAACNAFAFRFERVSVSYVGGGSWRPFVSAHRFLDSAHTLHDLAAAPAASGVYRSSQSTSSVLPYAFVASSS